METVGMIFWVSTGLMRFCWVSASVSFALAFLVGIGRPPFHWLVFLAPMVAISTVAVFLFELGGEPSAVVGIGFLGVFVYEALVGAAGWACGPVRFKISMEVGRT